MELKIPSGSALIDRLLDGGYERDALTTIYGPPGCGKTLLCMLATAHAVGMGRKVVYIDTEGNFSVARLQQLYPDAHRQVLDGIIFLKPIDFEEQAKAFGKLRTIADPKKVGLIVLDGAAMLYRLELGKNRDVFAVNREFGVQLSNLTEIARRYGIPVLITNQVYADINDEGKTKIVGGDILRYASKCMVEIRKLTGGNRIAELRKHRSLPEDIGVAFKITGTGLEEIELPGTQSEERKNEDRDFVPANRLEPQDR